VTTLASALVARLVAEAQPAGKVYRVGWLAIVPATPGSAPVWDAFIAALREGGFIEGQNLVIEGRYSVSTRTSTSRRSRVSHMIQIPR